MPTLPKPLRRPHPWLGLLLIGAVLFTVDIFLPAESQTSPALYRRAVGVYQWAKPRCGFEGCCRLQPSCSHYSVEAVHRFGVVEGLRLTANRIDRCHINIPEGTRDPLPETTKR